MPDATSTAKKALLSAEVLVVAGILAVAVIALLIDRGVIPSSRTVPPDINIKAIEDAYPELFRHANEVAHTGTCYASEEASLDKILPPEVWGIEVGRNRGYSALGHRTFDKIEARGFFPCSPDLGKPVLNQYWYVNVNGKRMTVIAYETLVPLKVGPPREIHVCFELTGLRDRLNAGKKPEGLRD